MQLHICIVILAVCWSTPANSLKADDFFTTVREAHKETAANLRDGGHHLVIRSMMLNPSEGCPEHHRCWTGSMDKLVHNETQPLVHGTHQITDLIVSVKHNGTFAWMGCGNNFTLSTPTTIDNKKYQIFFVPRDILKRCMTRLVISIREINRIGSHSKPLKLQLAIDLISKGHLTKEDPFIKMFHSKLTSGVRRNKLERPALPVAANHSTLSRGRRDIRKGSGNKCGLVKSFISKENLRRYVHITVGASAYPLYPSSLNMYHCAGVCHDVSRFPSQSDGDVSGPLKQQDQHDKYWTATDILKRLNIISAGPRPSCVGYDYKNLKIMVYNGKMVEHHISHPTKCSCV